MEGGRENGTRLDRSALRKKAPSPLNESAYPPARPLEEKEKGRKIPSPHKLSQKGNRCP